MLNFHPIASGQPDDTLGLSPTSLQYSRTLTWENETLGVQLPRTDDEPLDLDGHVEDDDDDLRQLLSGHPSAPIAGGPAYEDEQVVEAEDRRRINIFSGFDRGEDGVLPTCGGVTGRPSSVSTVLRVLSLTLSTIEHAIVKSYWPCSCSCFGNW